MSEKTILLTNDDGVNAEGIRVLKDVLAPLGRIIIVAPSSERSTTGQTLSLHVPLRVDELEEGVYSVSGYPADCTYVALHGILPRKPDLVISGINRGGNMGNDIYYSGTAAAARQAVMDGVPSISVSVELEKGYKKIFWEDVAEFTLKFASKFLSEDLGFGGFININSPNLPSRKIKGYKFTKMGQRRYLEQVDWRTDPRDKKYCWIGGYYEGFKSEEGTDCQVVEDGYISITPMKLDVTDYSTIERLKDWSI